MKERIYYHKIKGDLIPDFEAIIAYLLDEDVLYFGYTALAINCNDYFIPAADGEIICSDDLVPLFELYKKKQWDGVYEFVAAKRGIENKHWRDKMNGK